MATPVYSTVHRIHQRLKGKWVQAEDLFADSGAAQAGNEDLIYVADTAIFTVGDLIHIFADDQKNGEYKTVLAINADVSLQTDTDMIKDYTTAQNAKVQIRSEFSTRSKPNITEVEGLINEAEGKIDVETHHGWREKIKTETHSIKARYYNIYTGIEIHLKQRQVKALNAGSGDVLEVWKGNEWEDWLANKTEGRENDYWLNQTNGVLYLRQHYFYYRKDAIRITFRYGETIVPEDITRCATLLAAADILDIENYVAHLPGGPDLNIIEVEAKQNKWRKEAEAIILKHTEIVTI